MEQKIVFVFFWRYTGIHAGKKADVFCDYRADTCETCIDRFAQRAWFFF